ncbi:SpoIIE family protein phosphatase [Candidatus Kapabacteria bacterium]|nr:SpoIIE family protein phosphatase [Candidatus Kapabacteria bacterium]
MNIRSATILIIVSILTVSSILFYGLSVRDQVDIFQSEFEKYMDLTVESLTFGIEFSLKEENYEALYQSVYYTQSQEDVVVSAIIYHDDSTSSIDVSLPEGFNETHSYIKNHIINNTLLIESDTIYSLRDFEAGGVNGSVLVGFTTENIRGRIAESSFWTFIRLIIFVVIGVVIAYIFSNSIVGPINKLIQVSKGVGSGNLEIRADINKGGKDIKVLSTTFNSMLDKLDILQRQRVDELSSWNKTLEDKNEQIISSIRYASTIQNAILPSKSQFESLNLNSFIIYKPKDIVSGDFFWIDKFNDKTIVIVADCTGHGVPGAMISLMGNMILNDIIIKDRITNPSEILHKLDKELIRSLSQESEESFSSDGMDIGVVVIDKSNESLEYSGAMRPLYIVQNKKLTEIKGSKYHVGGLTRTGRIKTFENHKLEILNNQKFYLSSDGLVDQMGTSGKKLGSKKLKNELRNLSLDISIQEESLMKMFNEHIGNEDQRDDITLIGFEIL